MNKKENMMHFLSKKISFIVSLSLYASTLESLLPHPPFIRYGFAYIPIMIFASALTVKEFFLVILFKSLISGVLSLSLVSPFFLITLISSFLSGALIIIFEKLRESGKMRITHISVSVISAFVSNVCQIVLSYVMFFGDFSLFVSPLVFVCGFISSIFSGVISNESESKILKTYEKSDDITKDVKNRFVFKIKRHTISRFLFSYFIFLFCLFISSLFYPEGEVLFTLGNIKICSISMRVMMVKALIFTFLFVISFVMSSFLVRKERIRTSSVWIYYFYFTLNNPIANRNE